MKKSVILVLTVLIAIVFSNTILAQGIITSNDGKEELSNNLNPRLENRFGKNMNLLGPSVLVSFSIDYFINPTLNIETGIGILGYFGGIKYHIFGNRVNKKWTPNFGLYVTHIPEINFWGDSKSARNGLYIPMGIQYMSNSGFTSEAEVAGLTVKDIASGTSIWGGY
jgi:hypothetical protein